MTDIEFRSDVLGKIQGIIRQELNDPELVINEATTAADVPGWDSVTHVQIIVAVERTFGMRLKSSEVAQLENIGSLINVVLSRGTNR